MPDEARPFWVKDLLRARAEGTALLNAWCAIPSPFAAEIVARQGWDLATIDLQHGVVGYQTAIDMIRAVEAAGILAMARVPWLEPGICMKLLDAGARGLICPMVSTAADAEAFVSFTAYPPRGERSFGPTRAGLLNGAYHAEANRGVLRAVQIETAEAMQNLDAIAAVDGVDMLYVGPSDLAISMGLAPGLDATKPAVLEALSRVPEVARDNGILAGTHCATPERAGALAAMGYALITIQSDVRLLAASNAELAAAARGQIRDHI